MNSLNLEKIDLFKWDTNLSIFSLFNEEWRSYIEMPNNYYKLLSFIVDQLKPKIIVELGAYTGASTVALLSSMEKDSHIYSIDKIDDWRFVDKSDPRLSLLVGNSIELVDLVPNNIDIIFIDTDHTKDQITKEWEVYRHKISPNGVVILDDIHLNDGMTEFWNSLPYNKIDLSEYHNTGFGIFQF